MITTILGTIGVTLLVHNIIKQIKHDRMMKDFHEWMENDFGNTFDKFTKEYTEYYETGEGRILIENFKKGGVEF